MTFRPVFAAAGLLTLTACSAPPYINVDNAGLPRLLDEGAALVDVRRPEEWRRTGIVAGSEKLTLVDASGQVEPGVLDTVGARYAHNEPLVPVCRIGKRTDTLARHPVESMGYTRVYNVRDGIIERIRQGLPVSAG